jgi:uncharacterized membrane protein
MANNLEKDLDALIGDGILTQETAGAIRSWYHQKSGTNPNRLILVFGVLGVLLVSTGIILLVAHNWDNLNIVLKTFFAFLPLLIGQAWGAYTLLRKPDSDMHREMSAAWLAISIGACIALISQVYHLPGSIPSFLLTWLLLGLPVVYLLPSSVASLLFIAGATWYGVEAGYAYGKLQNQWTYWLLILAILPYYYFLYQRRPGGWLTTLHHYALPISLLVCLGILGEGKGSDWMWVAYMSLLGIFYATGTWLTQWQVTGIANGYKVIGWAGTVLLLFIASFRDFWKDIAGDPVFGMHVPLLAAAILTTLGIILLVVYSKYFFRHSFDPVLLAFLLYAGCFVLGAGAPGVAGIIINLYLLATGVVLLLGGQKQERLALLNLGLGIIAVLAICRFFDTDLSFILRGLIFIAVGVGFVYFNYQLIQKKQKA